MASGTGISISFTGNAASLNAASRSAAGSLNAVNASSRSASNAVTNFSRVIQDAPFGIVGIANNIEQLVVSFQQLRATTNTSGQAVRLFLSSLTGSGGLVLGISLITSALTFASVGFGAWTRGLSGSASATKKAKEEAEEYVETLNSVAKELSSEASKVTKLFSALESGDLNLAQRKKAIEELKGVNNEFFGELKEENGIVIGLQNAYDGYLQRLLDIGRAKAVETQITKLFDKKLQLELSIDPKFLAATDPQTVSRIGQLRKELQLLGGAVNFDEIKNVNLFDKTNEKLLRRVNLTRDISDLEKGNSFFADQAYKSTQAQIRSVDLQIAGLQRFQKDIGNFHIDEKAVSKIKANKGKIDIEDLDLRAARVGLTLSDFGVEKSTIAKRFDINGLIDTGKINAPSIPSITLPEPDQEQINRIKKMLQDLSGFFDTVAASITSSLGGAFSGLFDDILSGSQSAFASFGQALGNIIKKLIATAAAAAVLSFILGPLGLVKGSGGTALKGFDAFKSIFGKIGGFAEGGVVSGPTSGYPAILHGKEVVAPFDKFLALMQGGSQGFNGELSARVSGGDLLFVVNRAERNRGIIS